MTLKQGGTRESLRNIGVGVGATPDSVELQYFATNVSGGDATWPDNAENADMSLSGNETDETLSDGSEALGFNGTDTVGETTLPASLSGADLNAISIEFALQYSNTNTEVWTQALNSDGNQTIGVWTNKDESFNDENGNIYVQVDDDANSRFTFSFDSNPGLNDGSRHNLSIIITDAANNSANLILDGSSEAVAVGTAEGPSSFSTWDNDLKTGAGSDQEANVQSRADVDFGAIRWHGEAIGEQTIDAYP